MYKNNRHRRDRVKAVFPVHYAGALLTLPLGPRDELRKCPYPALKPFQTRVLWNKNVCDYDPLKLNKVIAILPRRLTSCQVEGVHHIVTREKGFMGARGPESRRWGAKGEGVSIQETGHAATTPSFGAFQLGDRLCSLQRVVLERPLAEETLQTRRQWGMRRLYHWVCVCWLAYSSPGAGYSNTVRPSQLHTVASRWQRSAEDGKPRVKIQICVDPSWTHCLWGVVRSCDGRNLFQPASLPSFY